MANRMISYGYGFDRGKLVVVESEANIVRWIFSKYVKGKILKDIANELEDKGIEFFNGNCKWNKNRIFRIISNRKYIGEDNYQPIVSLEYFDMANSAKIDRGNNQPECTPEVELLRKLVFCEKCGNVLHRKSKWKTREKWVCFSGCKCEKYIDDKRIFDAIFSTIAIINSNPEMLSPLQTDEITYKRTQEIMRYTNEISRFTNTQNPSFKAGKKIIFECANLKFQACKENKAAAYTDKIVQLTQEQKDSFIGVDYIKKVIFKITIGLDGTVVVEFINGTKISDREVENASPTEESSNKN